MLEPLPPALRGRPFTTESARRHGLSRRRLRRKDLCAPFYAVRSEVSELTIRERAEAIAARLSDGQWVTGYGAASIWGLPLPARQVPGVEIAVAKSSTRVTGRGLRPRELKPRLATGVIVNGVPVTDPLVTWCTLAKHATVEELIRAGDALVSPNPAYVGRRKGFQYYSIQELSRAVAAWKGCVGVGKLREALNWVRVGTASPPETDLRLLVIEAGLPEFKVNEPVHDFNGAVVGFVDGLIPAVRMVFEYEGDGHRTDKSQFRKDIRRYGDLDVFGYRVCRATADDVYRYREQFKTRARASYALALALTRKSAR